MKIQIMKIFKESFHHVWGHKLEWLKVFFAPFLIYVFGLLFMGFSYWSAAGYSFDLQQILADETSKSEPTPLMGIASIVYLITCLVSVFTQTINGYRYALFQEGANRWWTLPLNKRFVKMVLCAVLIGVLAVGFIAISAAIVGGIYMIFPNTVLSTILGSLLGLCGLYILFRLGLTFLFVSKDQSHPLKSSWSILKGNICRFVGLYYLVWLGTVGITLVGAAGLALLGVILYFINAPMEWVTFIFILIGFFLYSLLMLAWIIKATSLVYQELTEGKN